MNERLSSTVKNMKKLNIYNENDIYLLLEIYYTAFIYIFNNETGFRHANDDQSYKLILIIFFGLCNAKICIYSIKTDGHPLCVMTSIIVYPRKTQ